MSDVVKKLVRCTGLSERDVRIIISNAHKRYKVYYIKKKSGGRREIAQPSAEVKFLQRAFVEMFGKCMPVHEAATAYRTGLSIADNAGRHTQSGPILKLDFTSFFPSIKGGDWHKYCRDRGIFEREEDILLSTALLFRTKPNGTVYRLSIGAPSSPLVSNAMMYDFDQLTAEMCQREEVIYTRYADDLTFSAKRTGYLVNIERNIKNTLRSMEYPRLYINNRKTVLATTKYGRKVTGLVLTNEGGVSVGRERKRLVRAQLNHARHGDMTPEELSRLAGMLAFIKGVEPEFIARMANKYGETLLKEVFSASKYGEQSPHPTRR